MRFSTNSIILLLSVAFIFPACETLDVGISGGGGQHKTKKHHPGPPAHAPAHGHRKKHHKDNVQLSYDKPSGVYAVIGYADHFFSGDLYYRMSGDNWEISSGIAGPWRVTSESKVPKGLKDKKAKKPKGKNKRDDDKGKGKGKGKGRGNSK